MIERCYVVSAAADRRFERAVVPVVDTRVVRLPISGAADGVVPQAWKRAARIVGQIAAVVSLEIFAIDLLNDREQAAAFKTLKEQSPRHSLSSRHNHRRSSTTVHIPAGVDPSPVPSIARDQLPRARNSV